MKKLGDRYLSAYRVANATIVFGGLVKFCGCVLIALFFVVSAAVGLFFFRLQFEIAFGLGLLCGLVTGWPVYILGVLVQSSAQTTLATLDSAVHSSPFLSDKQKAIVMGLGANG